MATRRDQLQAYQFMMQRVISAVVVRETDPEQSPLRRGVGAVFAGIMIMVLIAAGFGVYGLFTGVGGTSWKSNGAIIVERETGATFVYRDGVLLPVLNYASARLISDGQQSPHRVSGKTLAGIPRRSVMGIAGAPDSLPAADRVLHDAWTMCSVPGTSVSGSETASTVLLVGAGPARGRPLGERGIMVREGSSGTHYLIWRHHRYRIAGDRPDTLIRSVFGAGVEIAEVGTAWLNGLPAGQDIGPLEVPGRGQASTVLSGHRVGEVVFHRLGAERQHFLVRADGLAPLTEFQLRVLSGQLSVTPAEISASVANAAPSSTALVASGGEVAPPDDPPQLATMPSQGRVPLCSRTGDAASLPRISLGGDAAALSSGIPTTAETEAGTKLADRVLVPSGRVAIVRAMPSGAAGPGALNVVTDLGVRYPVPSPDVLTSLGYGEADVVPMPAALVQRIPAGPTLDPAAAMAVAPALP